MGLFGARNLQANVVHRTKSGSVLRGLVAARFGYSILNICGRADRDTHTGYAARPIEGEVDSPLYGVAFAPQTEQSAIVRAVIATCTELTRQGSFQHLLLEP